MLSEPSWLRTLALVHHERLWVSSLKSPGQTEALLHRQLEELLAAISPFSLAQRLSLTDSYWCRRYGFHTQRIWTHLHRKGPN